MQAHEREALACELVDRAMNALAREFGGERGYPTAVVVAVHDEEALERGVVDWQAAVAYMPDDRRIAEALLDAGQRAVEQGSDA